MNRRHLFAAAAGALAVPVAMARPALAQFGMDPLKARILQAGGFSLQSSELALRNARNPRVRQFAQLERDEQAATAAALGAEPGAAPLRQDHAQMLEQLSRMSGGRFDAMYVRGQIMGHQELLELNRTAAEGGGDSLGRAVGMVSVPAIRTHLTLLGALRRA